MYRKPNFEEDTSLQVKLPWDTNTARGFGISMVFVILFLLLAPYWNLKEAHVRSIQFNSVPLVLLNFGDGDGTGISKGNLTKEGASRKGQEAQSILEDAANPALTKQVKNATQQDDNQISNPIPVKELSSADKVSGTDKGSGSRDIGTRDGVTDGSGLGSRGSGKGMGYGFGDIEWGGGGNRIVLHKPLPKFPVGVNTNAELKFRFTVMPDGTVGRIIPLQKADPRLETAALAALRQWRFNVLKEDVVMEGVIPLTFVLK
ncbi:MAG: energy transducer TonB [Candidatus Kapabacteria bacterium]|nr:energy transducer TonB [Ignavibacteriota bacterium]MCW5884379.1 energy transducer TonB [Candidatus Kapabacteria bacterium]